MFDLDHARGRLQRASGRAEVAMGARGLVDLHQSGSGKVMLPRTYSPVPEIVFLNTAGGVTGGDRFENRLRVEGAVVAATTQTAERAYRSTGPAARIDTRLRVGPDARLDWLPQETILFDGAHLHRETRVDLQGSAELVLVDILVLGRIAMGETLKTLDFLDRREITRDQRPVLVDNLRLTEAQLTDRGPAGLRPTPQQPSWDS